MNALRAKSVSGFTMVELIVVIVILGILSATALPKFMDLSGSARKASLATVKGTIESTANIFHAKMIAEGNAKKSEEVTIDGTAYWNHWGYPHVKNSSSDARSDIVALAGLSSDDYILTYSDTLTHGGDDTVTISIKGAANAAKCFVSYEQANSSTEEAKIDSDLDEC